MVCAQTPCAEKPPDWTGLSWWWPFYGWSPRPWCCSSTNPEARVLWSPAIPANSSLFMFLPPVVDLGW